jgi:hypothetical protein
MRGAGGTSSGIGVFFVGLAMIVVGGYPRYWIASCRAGGSSGRVFGSSGARRVP